jgi:hypothetical protein
MYVLDSLAAVVVAPPAAAPAEAAPPATTAPLAAALAVLGEVRRPRVREVRRRARLVDDVGLAPEDDRDAALARALLLRQQVDAVLEACVEISGASRHRLDGSFPHGSKRMFTSRPK